MALSKSVDRYSDDDILKIVNLDFEESIEDRANKNWQNYLYEKTFLGIDLMQPITPTQGDNNLGLDLAASEVASDKPVRSQIYMPWARSKILALKTMICTGIWPNNTDFFDVQSGTAGDQDRVKAFREYAHYDMRRESSSYLDETELAIERCLINDFSLLWIGYEQTYDWRPEFLDVFRQVIQDTEGGRKRLNVGSPIGKRAKYVMKKVAGGVCFRTPSTYNVRHDSNAIHGQITPKTCDWVGLEYEISARRLQDMADRGELDKGKTKRSIADGDKVETTAIDFDAMIRADLKLESERKGQSYEDGKESGAKEQMRHIEDYWDTRGGFVTVINKKYVVRKGTAPLVPFTKFVTYPVHGQFGGVPLIHDLVHIQIDINTMIRLRRDAQNQAVNKTMILDGSAFRSDDEARNIRLNALEAIVCYPQPGRTVTDAVGWVTPPDIGGTTFTEQQNEMQFGDRIVGVGDAGQGVTTGTRRTATENELIATGSSRLTGFNARTLERAAIQYLVPKMLVLYNLYLTDEQKYRVVGPMGTEWRRLSPTDLFFQEPPEVIPIGLSSQQSKALHLDLFIRGLEYMLKVPDWNASTDWQALKTEFLNMLEVRNPSRFTKANLMLGIDVKPEAENVMMAGGFEIEPLQSQNHNQHIMAHEEFTKTPNFMILAPEVQELIVKHIEKHAQMRDNPPQPQPTAGTPGPMATPNSQAEMMAQVGRRAGVPSADLSNAP